MKDYNQFILESINNERLIAVDIQPAYENYINFSMNDLTKWIKNKNFSDILWLYNGPEMGYESEEEIKYWLYEQSEFSEESGEYEMESENIAYFEKGYAFLRDLMDAGVPYDDIVEIGKYMIKKDIRDTIEFKEDELEYLSKKKGIDVDYLNGNNYSMYIPEIFDILKEYKGDDIILIGGGVNECLLEIELVLDILEIPYKKEKDFVY